jgi:non-ribosomal peptide synthetase component F
MGAPAALRLPFDRPRPPVQTFHGALEFFTLEKELANSLKDVGEANRATLFMVLLAGFNVLLHYYSKQGDIVVGCPVANRIPRETEKHIGFFVNTLPFRIIISENLRFAALIKQTREHALGAYAHQDVPLDRLIEELRIERDPSRAPLFQVMFGLFNAPVPNIRLHGLALEQFDFEIKIAKFDLTVTLQETGNGLTGVWEYNTDLFEQATIRNLAANYRSLLAHVAGSPSEPIEALMAFLKRVEDERQALNEQDLKVARMRKFREVKRRTDGLASSEIGK